MDGRDLIGVRASERFNPVRTGMKLWYLKTMMDRGARMPTPSDPAAYRSGARAWRVLLVGNGATHGWGVKSHEDSLTGQLGEQLGRRSDHPVSLDYVGDELMNAQSAVNWLADVELANYDLIILLIGWNDAVRLTPVRIWEESLRILLGELRSRKRQDAGLLTIGIEPMSKTTGYSGFASRIGQRHADRLNEVLRSKITEPNEAYMPLNKRRVQFGAQHETWMTYRMWAKDIALVASKLLPQRVPDVAPEQKQYFNWVGAAATLGHKPSDVPQQLRQIEAEARRGMRAQIAQVTLIESGRQWFANHEGAAPASTPLCLSYCETATKSADVLIVPNASKDERFRGNPYIDQNHMVFYIGCALTSRSGAVIGTFCVLDVMPRPKWLINRKRFEQFAKRAQEALWAVEDIENAKLAHTKRFMESLQLGQPKVQRVD